MSERVESCTKFVRRIVRSLTEWRAAMCLMENCNESDCVESCKEFVRRIIRGLTEWRAERSLLGEL